MEKIYVIRNGKNLLGPYTLEGIKRKGIYSTDVVWFEGIPNNTPALEMDDLKDAFKEEIPAYKMMKRRLRRFLRIRTRKKVFGALKTFFTVAN